MQLALRDALTGPINVNSKMKFVRSDMNRYTRVPSQGDK